MYRPEANFNVPMKILTPEWVVAHGVRTKVYPKVEDVGTEFLFFADFKTYGGSENSINGVYSITDTATINTWYRPDITSDCAVCLLSNGRIYEIINEPENIEMRNQFLQFKVKRLKGKS